MLNYRKLFFPLFIVLVFAVGDRVNGTTPIIVGQDSLGKKPTEVHQDTGSPDIPKSKIFEFSENEKRIIDELKRVRVEREIGALDVNPRISEAIRQELEKIINSNETSLTSQQIKKRLNELVAYLGGVSFIIKGKSFDKLFNRMKQSEKLQKEIADSTNLTMAVGLVRGTVTNTSYCIIYLCKYSIEYGISMVSGPPPPQPGGGTPNTVFLQYHEINGKCNGKYLKYYLCKARGLPFYIEKEDVSTGELQTDENRGFTIRISYNAYKIEERHLAIFAKTNPSETYSLVDILMVKSIG